MQQTKVTVLMPVYNGEKYLKEAINSILNQTFTDFEFLIIDDGSTDSSVKIIESFNDSRINLMKNNKNLRLPATLNKGISLAKGKYIARMDCDDISLPMRLEMQVDFLEKNTDVGICGSRYITIGEEKIRNLPLANDLIRSRLLFHCVLKHPTIMIRKSIILLNNLYYRNTVLEDYDLWIRCSRITKIVNLKESLVKCRNHDGQVTNIFKKEISEDVDKQIYALLKELGIEPTEDEWELHRQLKWLIPSEYTKGKRRLPVDSIDFEEKVEKWASKILKQNEQVNLYNHLILNQMFAEYIEDLGIARKKLIENLKAINNFRPIFLWGTGNYGKNFLELLKKNEIPVKGFIDNAKERWGTSIEGIQIYSPKILVGNGDKEIPFILIASMYNKEISLDLEKTGLIKDRDFIEIVLY